MSDPFAIEWLGGVAEHHFYRARPDGADIPWHELDGTRYRAEVLVAARRVWTDVALSEYAAISQFSQVVEALTAARAPLDLIGLVSDFVVDEVKHVELASRLVMQMGGAARRDFEPRRLNHHLPASLTPLQRANELAIRIGCIGEPYASGTAATMMKATGHPVVRTVYETILRDESRHTRFGSLYFEWAGERLDDAERTRLAGVALGMLAHYARLWRAESKTGQAGRARPVSDEEARELGWFTRGDYTPLAVATVREDILPPLRALGLPLDEAKIAALLA